MLEWNVFWEDPNKRKIVVRDIFQHAGFWNSCLVIKKKYSNDKETFGEKLRWALQGYFWCRCEYELVMSDWPPSEGFDGRKVDIFEQIDINWDRFLDYVWNNKDDIQ